MFFFLNIEAVVFILLSIGGGSINEVFSKSGFTISTGVFSIYVILLQYYINGLNYDERALRLHYHQLDIEDLILKLKSLIMSKNSKDYNPVDGDIIESFNSIMFKYQSALKNNENHDLIDFNVAESRSTKNKYLESKFKIVETTNEKGFKKIKISVNKVKNKIIDSTVNNLFLWLNKIIIFGPLIFLYIYMN